MKRFEKAGEVQLDGDAYWRFKLAVHELDRWRCKVCGRIEPLSLHHMTKRSKLRLDVKDNVLSVCIKCHNDIEEKRITVCWVDVAARIVSVRRS